MGHDRSEYRNNLRYHLMMQLAWKLNKSRPVHPAALKLIKVNTLTDADIKTVLDHTIGLFAAAGAQDKVAKGDALTETLKQHALVGNSNLATPTAMGTVAAPAAAPALVAPAAASATN